VGRLSLVTPLQLVCMNMHHVATWSYNQTRRCDQRALAN
jgi:hypothetical protein